MIMLKNIHTNMLRIFIVVIFNLVKVSELKSKIKFKW